MKGEREAVIVGEGSFALRAIDLIAGCANVRALASRDGSLEARARQLGVPHVRTRRDLPRLVHGGVDWLFSLNNPWILSPEVLAGVRGAALNWHDGPLPRYAGLYATSWAIAAGETEHVSVFHELTPDVDRGRVIAARRVDVADDERAWTLNAKCFEAGLDALEEVLEQLAAGRPFETIELPGPSSQLDVHHGLADRPPDDAIFDPHVPAVVFERWARALDFGRAPNPFCSPKVWARGALWVPTRVRLVPGHSDARVGQVLAVRERDLEVQTVDGALALEGLRDLDGGDEELRVRVGAILERAPHVARWRERAGSLARFERRWTRRRRLPALRHPNAGRLDDPPPGAGSTPPEADVSFLFAERCGHDADTTAIALVLAWLRRVSLDEGCAVGLHRPDDDAALFAEIVPLRVPELLGGRDRRALPEIREQSVRAWFQSIAHELERIERWGTFARDAWTRRHLEPASWPVEIRREGLPSEDAELVLDLRARTLRSGGALHQDALAAMAASLEVMMASLTEDAPVATVPLTVGEPWLAGPARALDPRLVPERFDAIARAHADAFAVACTDRTLTYGALRSRVEEVAGALAAWVMPHSTVAVSIRDPLDALVAILATLRLGAAYVPIDASLPAARVRSILEDAAPALAIVDAPLAGAECPEVRLDGLAPAPTPPLVLEPDMLAYRMFTSGSTGRPKGVDVSHGALAAQLDARIAIYGSAPRAYLPVHSFAFDSVVAGIYGALCTGGGLVLPTVEERHDPLALLGLIERHRVSHLDLPPALHAELLSFLGGLFDPSPHGAEPSGSPLSEDVSQRAATLTDVVVGGDVCSVRCAKQHFARLPGVRLHNEYGPTEATVFATVHAMNEAPQGDSVPIGAPIPNVRLARVDRHRQPLPDGLPGELVIAGPTLAEGYCKRPEVTADRFVELCGERVYRTGDVVRFERGRVIYEGRIDRQIQIRGYRVELSGIEHVLSELPGVDRAVVAFRRDGSDVQLFGYVVPELGASLDSATLRQQLARRLPIYMLPAHVAVLDRLPTTGAGKLDRDALPRLDVAPQISARPSTPTEAAIARIFAEVLGRSIGTDASFFEHGGTSLGAIRVVRRVRDELGASIRVLDVFRQPTIRSLATRIESDRGSSWRYLDAIRTTGHRTPLFFVGSTAQARLLAPHLPERPVYGLSIFGLPDALVPNMTLQAVADEFLPEILAVQSTGPYLLAGFCDDSRTAYELARRLRERGAAQVGLLAIDGGWLAGAALRASRAARVARIVERVRKREIRPLVDSLIQRVRFRTDLAMTALARFRLGASDDVVLRNQALVHAYRKAQLEYATNGEPDPAEIVILLSRDYAVVGSPFEGRAVEVRPMPLDHQLMFQGDQVDQLGQLVGRYLEWFETGVRDSG